MEDNRVIDIRDLPMRGYWPGFEGMTGFLKTNPDTMGSLLALREGLAGDVRYQEYPGAWVIYSTVYPRGIEAVSQESDRQPVNFDSTLKLYSKVIYSSQNIGRMISSWRHTNDIATTTDVTNVDNTLGHRSVNDFQAEEVLGIFTVSRRANVISRRRFLLSSSLPRRKPNIVPYEFSENDDE